MNKAKSIGIVAGWGDYPLAVARALREKGYEVVVAAVHGHASKEIESLKKNLDQVSIEAKRDFLTGTANRKCFDAFLEEQVFFWRYNGAAVETLCHLKSLLFLSRFS